MSLVVLSSLVRDFAAWMDHLRAFIFTRAAPAAALGLLLPLLHNYLGRAVRRLDNLVVRWERGLLPARLPPAPPAEQPSPGEPPDPAARSPHLPGRQAWLLKLHPAFALYCAAVQRLLDDPETRALVAAAPQAGRILRPLARMLGIPLPDWLKLPPRPRKPRAPKPREPRRRLRPIAFTRAQIDRMTAADLTAVYGRLPPHFPLPIPNLNYIRRKIAAG